MNPTSASPTIHPTVNPSTNPSVNPSTNPTPNPTGQPSVMPTMNPTPPPSANFNISLSDTKIGAVGAAASLTFLLNLLSFEVDTLTISTCDATNRFNQFNITLNVFNS